MRTLALVPARAGSKGVPGKNTRDFCGKPLLDWALEVGEDTCDEVWLSTDDHIAERSLIAHIKQWNRVMWGLHKRPPELARDDTPMLDVVKDVIGSSKDIDVIVLLQPTQPLRRPEHVREALRLLEETGADSVVSVVEVPSHLRPQAICEIDQFGRGLVPYALGEGEPVRLDEMPTRRQDCASAYYRDGTVYAIRRETIEQGSLYGSKCVPLVIPAEESCTIDTPLDWERAEEMMRRNMAHA